MKNRITYQFTPENNTDLELDEQEIEDFEHKYDFYHKLQLSENVEISIYDGRNLRYTIYHEECSQTDMTKRLEKAKSVLKEIVESSDTKFKLNILINSNSIPSDYNAIRSSINNFKSELEFEEPEVNQIGNDTIKASFRRNKCSITL